MTSTTRDNILWVVVNTCRLLVSATFVFSGVVKLIDRRDSVQNRGLHECFWHKWHGYFYLAFTVCYRVVSFGVLVGRLPLFWYSAPFDFMDSFDLYVIVYALDFLVGLVR